jgi:hypothetical protein
MFLTGLTNTFSQRCLNSTVPHASSTTQLIFIQTFPPCSMSARPRNCRAFLRTARNFSSLRKVLPFSLGSGGSKIFLCPTRRGDVMAELDRCQVTKWADIQNGHAHQDLSHQNCRTTRGGGVLGVRAVSHQQSDRRPTTLEGSWG